MSSQRASDRQRYRFGEFLIDIASRELRHGDQFLTLSPRAFDCVVYLIDHRERAVGRDELGSAVWGRADVTDIQLDQLIRKIRSTLHDRAREQAIVRTVPRFGFRWVAPTQADDAPPALDPRRSEPSRPGPPASSKPARPKLLGNVLGQQITLAVLTVLAATAAAYRLHVDGRSAPKSASAAAGWVVILPVKTSNEDQDWAWIRLGLMDQIAARVRSAGIVVVPSDNVIALTSHAIAPDDMDAAQTATGAQYVVRPAAIRSGAGWALHLEMRSSAGLRREIGAQGANPTDAASLAADQLIVALGRQPRAGVMESDEWVQRVDAALMASDFATAAQLIESAPATLRDSQQLRFSRARLDLSTGHYQDASNTLTQLLAEGPEESTQALRANIQRVLGVTTVRLGDADAADVELTSAISSLERLNEPEVLGKAYIDRAGTRLLLGHNDEGAADLARARVILEPIGDSLAVAWIDANEGALHALRGHHVEALPLFAKAELAFARFGATRQLVGTIGNEIDSNLRLLLPSAALSASERAYLQANAEVIGAEPAFRFQRLRALIANGHTTDARNLINESTDDGDPVWVASIRGLEASLDLDGGDAEHAYRLAIWAIDALPERAEFASTRASTWLVAIKALMRQRRDDEADTQLRRFVAFARRADNRDARIEARLAEAEHAWHMRPGTPDAVAVYENALRLANETGVPDMMAGVAVSYGNALISQGDLSGASAVAGQVTRWADRDFDCALLLARLYRALGQRDPWRAALDKARAVAGERAIPADVISSPSDAPISAVAATAPK